MNEKYILYKNDLKFSENINLEESEFETEDIKNIYTEYKKRPKIDLRIRDSELENYEYLDLSKLEITDEIFIKLKNVDRITTILRKIKFLDLSNNKLTNIPKIDEYKNIIFLNISENNISGNIVDNNLIELVCDNNKLESIISNTLERLVASNNIINKIELPNIKLLVINNNKLNKLEHMKKLEYLECMDNNIERINDLGELQELYISNNKLVEMDDNMFKLNILNCINNPISKINYYSSLNMLLCSTPQISSKYNISNFNKIKNDYLINFN